MSKEMPDYASPVKTLRLICTHGISDPEDVSSLAAVLGRELRNIEMVTVFGPIMQERSVPHNLAWIINGGEDDMWLLQYHPESGALTVEWGITVDADEPSHFTWTCEHRLNSVEWSTYQAAELLLKSPDAFR
jgi:hypothetical protein